jgi:hypothetical protein
MEVETAFVIVISVMMGSGIERRTRPRWIKIFRFDRPLVGLILVPLREDRDTLTVGWDYWPKVPGADSTAGTFLS